MAQQIHLLGLIQIETDGQPSDLMRNARGCALLAYLLITQEVQPREVVADLLWEAGSTAKSLKNLRTLLPHMRRCLPGFAVTRQTVQYQPGSEVFVDLTALRKGLAEEDISQLDTALLLYKGELLETFYLPDAPRFNEYLSIERENLRRQVMLGYHRLCAAYAERQEWVAGVAAAQRWLALDELDEAALRWLMQFLAASGQVAVALQQYEHSRQRLWQELEVEPEPASVELAQKLTQLQEEQGEGISWDRIVGAQVERPLPGELAEPGPLPSNAYLPYQRNHDFTGRKASLLFLADMLLPSPGNDGRQQAVAVTGMGGIGKTQLAVEFCYRYGRYYPGGVYWLSFAQAENVAAEVATIGGERGLGLYRQADKLILADQVGRVQKAWQEPVPRLLIFDNCEEEDLLAEWLPKTGGCHILLTSRRGDLSPELGVVQRPLPILDPSESVAVLRRLAPDLTEAEAAEIAAEVGHLPLALHLSGSFLRRYHQVTPADYLAQLRDKGLLQHPALQGRGTRHSPTGHELNVARTFAVNLEQLDPADEVDGMARQLLVRIACFAPGELVPRLLLQTTVIDGETMADDDLMAMLLVEDGLARLIGLGFVAERGQDGVVMHHLLVAFTRLEMAGVAEGETAVEKAVVQAIEAIWNPTTSHLGNLPLAASHVQTVTDTALDRNSAQCGRLAGLWGRHLMDVGNLQQARPYLEQALAHQEAMAANEKETAETVQNLGTLMWKLSEMEAAWAYYKRGLDIHQRIFGPHHIKTAHSLNNLGILQARSGSFAKAQSYYEQALAIYEQIPESTQEAIARTLFNLGVMHNRRGKFKQAHSYHKRALAIRQKNLKPDHLLLAESLNSVGLTCVYMGAYEEALSYYQQALAIREKVLESEHPSIGHSLSNLGHLYLQTGEYEQAKIHLEKGVAIQEAARPNHMLTSRSLNFLGDLYLQLGKPEEARPYLERALSICEQQQSQNVDTAHTLISLGEYYQAVGNETEAQALYERALAILQETAVVSTHPDLQRVQNLRAPQPG